jgi:hypothetical protein
MQTNVGVKPGKMQTMTGVQIRLLPLGLTQQSDDYKNCVDTTMDDEPLNRKLGIVLFLFAVLCFGIGLVVISYSMFCSPQYSYTISPSMRLRIWEESGNKERIAYVFTYHKGVAIGLYVQDRIITSNKLDLTFAEDNLLGLKVVYDKNLGAVFIYDCIEEAYWAAGRVYGSDGSDWQKWAEKLSKLRCVDPRIPDRPIQVIKD